MQSTQPSKGRTQIAQLCILTCHDSPLSHHTSTLFSRQGMTSLVPVACSFSPLFPNHLQSFNNSGANGAMATKNRSGSICYDFVKGVCTRGAECRYSHDLTLIARMARTSNGGAAEVDQNQGQQSDVCFDFLRCVDAANIVLRVV